MVDTGGWVRGDEGKEGGSDNSEDVIEGSRLILLLVSTPLESRLFNASGARFGALRLKGVMFVAAAIFAARSEIEGEEEMSVILTAREGKVVVALNSCGFSGSRAKFIVFRWARLPRLRRVNVVV